MMIAAPFGLEQVGEAGREGVSPSAFATTLEAIERARTGSNPRRSSTNENKIK